MTRISPVEIFAAAAGAFLSEKVAFVRLDNIVRLGDKQTAQISDPHSMDTVP